MKDDVTLYDKALSNYNSAMILRQNLSDDDNQLNIIAYLIQQSVELMMKFLLELSGTTYPKTHDIDQLVRIAKESGADLHLTEYIEDHGEMFSQWESKSRYVIGYLVELSKIDKALKGVEEYFCKVHDALEGRK